MDKNYLHIMVLLMCGFLILIVPWYFVIPLLGTCGLMLAFLFRDIEEPPHD